MEQASSKLTICEASIVAVQARIVPSSEQEKHRSAEHMSQPICFTQTLIATPQGVSHRCSFTHMARVRAARAYKHIAPHVQIDTMYTGYKRRAYESKIECANTREETKARRKAFPAKTQAQTCQERRRKGI
jgi:hypothetical protein